MGHPLLGRFSSGERRLDLTPRIRLSSNEVNEDSDVGTLIGYLAVENGTGDYYTFELLNDPDEKFEIVLNRLMLLNPLNFEEQELHSIGINAISEDDGSVLYQNFTIQVGNVAEGELGPPELRIPAFLPIGTVVGQITGLDESLNERIVGNSTDGKLSVNDQNEIVTEVVLEPQGLTGEFYTSEDRVLITDIYIEDVEPIYRIATRQYGAGYSAENVQLTGDGTLKTYSANFVNESGRQMETVALAFQGWGLTATGTQVVGNDNTMSGTITYNGVTQSFQDVIVPNGGDTQNADLALSTPIPAGASFSISVNSLVASGAKYPPRLGFAGVLSKALESELKLALYGIGDSIATNNGAALMNASVGKCPVYQASIVGTTAQTYGASSAANFARQVSLAKRLGVVAFFSNFGTNDLIGGRTAAQILGDLGAMRALGQTENVGWIQATMLPRVSKKAAVAVTSLTSIGNTMTLKVADPTIFAVGQAYSVAGATPAGYNGSTICTGIDAANGQATFVCAAGLASPATGAITITARNPTNTIYWQQPANNSYNPGGASARGVFNQAVRSGPITGDFDACVDWADAVEPFRDSGRFAVAGEKTKLPMPVIATVISGGTRTTTRFMTDYGVGSNTLANGLVQFITGANAGLLRGGSGNTNGDITLLTALTAVPAIGDQLWVWPGVSYQSDDGIHDRVATGGFGGQELLDDATEAFLSSLLT